MCGRITNTESHINIMLKNGEMAPWSHHPKGKGSQVREGGAPRGPGRGPVPPMGLPGTSAPAQGGGERNEKLATWSHHTKGAQGPARGEPGGKTLRGRATPLRQAGPAGPCMGGPTRQSPWNEKVATWSHHTKGAQWQARGG